MDNRDALMSELKKYYGKRYSEELRFKSVKEEEIEGKVNEYISEVYNYYNDNDYVLFAINLFRSMNNEQESVREKQHVLKK